MRQILFLLSLILFSGSARAGVIIETADGLPVEVDIVTIYRNDVTIRYKASKREAKLDLSKLPEAAQKEINEEADRKRKSVKSVNFNAKLDENPSTAKEQAFIQKGFLNAGEMATGNSTKIIRAGGRFVRITASTNAGVDVPLNVTIYWYAQVQGRSSATMEEPEEVVLNPTMSTTEYISRAPGFARRDYRGFAVIAINPANGEVVGKGSSGASYLQDAESRSSAKK